MEEFYAPLLGRDDIDKEVALDKEPIEKLQLDALILEDEIFALNVLPATHSGPKPYGVHENRREKRINKDTGLEYLAYVHTPAPIDPAKLFRFYRKRATLRLLYDSIRRRTPGSFDTTPPVPNYLDVDVRPQEYALDAQFARKMDEQAKARRASHLRLFGGVRQAEGGSLSYVDGAEFVKGAFEQEAEVQRERFVQFPVDHLQDVKNHGALAEEIFARKLDRFV